MLSLNKLLEMTLNHLFAQARLHRQVYVSVEDLLLSLLNDNEVIKVLQGCGGKLEALQSDLTGYIKMTTPLQSEGDFEAEPTLAFQRVLQRAIFQAQSSGQGEANSVSVLIALFSEQDSQAVFFLKRQGISRASIVNFLAHGIPAQTLPELPQSVFQESAENNDNQVLENFVIDLNKQVAAGGIDPLIGRETELLRTIEILCRRRKNHPLLIGEAGVGKTAIAEGLARLIVSGEAPESLATAVIYALDLGAMLAGTKYRGDFEKRFKQVLQQLQQQSQAILFIDEIHTIIGAGVASSGVLDAANLLKPLLTNGNLKCIGATTYQEYRNIFSKDSALVRRFQKIEIAEPTIEQTLEILKGLCSRFENYHHVKYTMPALKAAIELSQRYLTDRFLPDKAIDIIDEAGAHQALQPKAKRKKIIGVSDVEAVVARMARIPAKNIAYSDKNRLKNLTRDLKLMVFGQDKAIEALGGAIKLSRSGLGNEQKPIGCFLFAGPTGVGKTEVTRQLAHTLGIELLRFDMSEYMERHTASRLIGAPPGYVGYEQGGLLTEAVIKHPHAVLLLDEIEKAHQDVFNLLLQVMDHSTLTDNNGRKADFRHIILVMTTNAGAAFVNRPSVGFVEQDHSDDSFDAIKTLFAPEFRNRLDGIIQFNHLPEDVLIHVVHKLLTQLEIQLEHKKVHLVIDEAIYHWLVINGYDKEMGARPMARVIQEKIKKPLAEELLFGQLTGGGKVAVTIVNNDLVLQITPRTTLALPTFSVEKTQLC